MNVENLGSSVTSPANAIQHVIDKKYGLTRKLISAWDKVSGCLGSKPKDAVCMLNCTWSDFDKDGAKEVHQDAARRAYGYFKSQNYDGPIIMVMVDSSAEANQEMLDLAAQDSHFFYFHLNDRNNVPQTTLDLYPEAAEVIKGDDFFTTAEYSKKLQWVKSVIDHNTKNPLEEGIRPPLGSKRNFGMAVADQVFEELGLKHDVTTYIDDDIYGEGYVRDAVANLQGGKVFTAECSYYVALPQANLDEPGAFEVQHGTYVYGQSAKNFTWLDQLGHPKQPEKGDVLSDKPYGFTYAVRRDAAKKIGGVMDILRGEDRTLLYPLIDEYGEKAISLRNTVSGNLVRLLGDNNSANAVRRLGTPILSHLKPEIERIFEKWTPMLGQKFMDKLDLASRQDNVVDIRRVAQNNASLK